MFSNKVELLLHATNAATYTDPSLDSPNSPASSPPPPCTDNTSSFEAASASKNDFFHVSITTQPPLKTVYQRILKPFPTVTLTVVAPQGKHKGRRRSRAPLSDDEAEEEKSAADLTPTVESADKDIDPAYADVLETLLANGSNSSSNGLFAEVTLLRGDNGEPISKCLDGNSIVRFEKNPWSEGVYTATFKKLKILSTSQQLQGILFRLKFTLKKYVGSTFTTIPTPDCAVVSHPVEVFSHSQYLNKKAPKPSTSNSSARRDFKELFKKMDGRKVHNTLFSVLQAFKEQGGTRESVLDVVQRVYGDDDAKPSGVPRRMSAPPAYTQSQPQPQPQLMIAPALPAQPSDAAAPQATTVELQFLNELLTKFQLGAMSLDDFVGQLVQGVGRPRASQLLSQLGLAVDSTTALGGHPSLSVPLTAPAPQMVPSFAGTAALNSSDSIAAILSALAHQQAQLAQLQAAHHHHHQQQQQGQQLAAANPYLQQLQLQQQLAAATSSAAAAAVLPVMPKPRRPSGSASPPQSATNVVSLPLTSAAASSSVAAASSASSSLSALADAISSLSAPTASPLSPSGMAPLLPPPTSFLDRHSTFAANITLPPIADTGASASSGPLPSFFSLSSLASVISDSSRGRKRSLDEASLASPAAPTASPPSPNMKAARLESSTDASSASSASSQQGNEEKVQWYWKNNTTWEPYAEGVSMQLERAHKNQTPCVVVLHDVPYKMDFQSMTQQRIDNPKRWKHIRRGEN